MAINMPNDPTIGEIYLATNGINYEWDGDKWEIYVNPSSGVNLWDRDNATGTIYPVNSGDSIGIKNSGNTITVTLSDDGSVTALNYNIDTLSQLP